MARTVDVTGLSWELIEVVEWFVAILREADVMKILPHPSPEETPTQQMAHYLVWALKQTTFPTRPSPDETKEEWKARLRAWAEGYPDRPVEIDDSRETIYAGRGE